VAFESEETTVITGEKNASERTGTEMEKEFKLTTELDKREGPKKPAKVRSPQAFFGSYC